MPSRKTLLLLAGYLLLVGATALSVWGRQPRHYITEGKAAMIREGMTEDQVVELLGVPAGDYTSGPWAGEPQYGGGLVDPQVLRDMAGPRLNWKDWVGDQGRILIGFDVRGVVRRSKFQIISFDERIISLEEEIPLDREIITLDEESPLDRLRRWLKRCGLWGR